MRILKYQSNYLPLKAKRNRNIGLCLLGSGSLGVLISFTKLGTIAFLPLFIVFLFVLLFGFAFLGDSANYSRGLAGEDLVTWSLSSLNDEYYLINDVRFSDSYGNIDHIVLGPNGVFVVESKNYRGEIECVGDEWARYYEAARYQKYYGMRSPSRQVKRNALKIKQIIDSAKIFDKSTQIWVEGILVFTDPHVYLRISYPTVPILRTDQLCEYIASKQSGISFSSQELKSIALTILNQSRA